jgi:hypothetical protein
MTVESAVSANDARLLADAPRSLFGTAARMFAAPYAEIQELQLVALRQRFEHLAPRVPLLARLAKRNGVDGVDSLAAGGRLLYPSNVYKSYPFAWLADGEYGRLTRWLQQLTAHDLTSVNLEGVETLDEWFERLEAATDLRLCHSSSTSGKLSFLPRGVAEWTRRSAATLFAYERAGRDDGPEQVSLENLPFISTFYRRGHSAILMHTDWMIRSHVDPDGTHPERILTLYPGAMSSEIMVLAGRLRAGQLSGDPRSVQLPPRLLQRRSELTALLEGATGERIDSFVREASERFSGQRCMVGGVWPTLVDAAAAAQRLGLRDVFDPTSFVMSGGGEKGRSLPENAPQLVMDWTGVRRMSDAYGMSELMGANVKCSAGKFHLNPWLIPYVLDVDTLEPLPAEGVVTGRFGGIDLTAGSFWSGYMSTDLVTLTRSPKCACGREGPYLDREIRRVSNVEDDKISCAATPGAHDATIEFLRSQGA